MSLNKKATAVAGIAIVAASGAWAQTGQSTSGMMAGGGQDAQTAQKAQALGFSSATLSSLTAAERKTLTRLFSRMTPAERQAVTKLMRSSSGGVNRMGGMNGSQNGTTGTGTSGSGTGTSGTGSSGAGTESGTPGTGTPGTTPGTTP